MATEAGPPPPSLEPPMTPEEIRKHNEKSMRSGYRAAMLTPFIPLKVVTILRNLKSAFRNTR